MKKIYLSLPENKTGMVEFLFWTIIAYALFTWFSLQIHTVITADTIWLCEAAERFLSGEKMSLSYYDPNPPLSVLLYIPPVLAAMTGMISIYHAVFGYTLIIALGCASFTYHLLKSMPGVEATTALTVTAAFIMTSTILASLGFTERDHILGMALVPFVLTQVAITKKWTLSPALKHITLILGSVLILVKPHHGLLPTLILIHRAVTQKRLNVWQDPDFLYLAGAVLTYGALLFFVFSDYLHIVFPDVLSLYTGESRKHVLMSGLFYGMIYIIGMLISVIVGDKSWLSRFFLIAALVSLIPYIVQMRGYQYQLLPAAIFFWCSMSVLGKETLQKFMAPHLSMILITLIVAITAFFLTPARVYFPRHEQYNELPMAKFLESCEFPCPFLVINNHIEITHQTALYMKREWASRFPSFWFMSGILSDNTTASELERYRQKYGDMVAEDLARYKPEVILITEYEAFPDKIFRFVEFFMPVESFREEWVRYERTDDFVMDQGVYFTGTRLGKQQPRTYQVYRRIKD